MASITQKITSYVHGISQQPDHLLRPGQVRNLVNGLPDVTHGLMKRPGSQVITELSGVDNRGKWFTIFRDNQEKYLGRIRDGKIRVWSILDGTEKTVQYSLTPGGADFVNNLDYLYQTSEADLDVLTVNDYTFIVNKTKKVVMSEQSANIRPYEAFVQIRLAEYNTVYDLIISAPDAVQDQEQTSASGLVTSPPPQDRGGSGGKIGYQAFTVNGPAGSGKVGLSFAILTNGQPTYYDPNGEEYDVVHWNYSTVVQLMGGGSGWEVGDSVNVSMNGHTYNVRVTSIGKSLTYSKLIPTTPYVTPRDQTAGVVSFTDILQSWQTDINSNTGWEATIIGSGLYIKGPEKFAIYSTGGRTDDTIFAFTTKVNNITYLPNTCKDGYVVKIMNTGEIDDDYYVKFVGNEPGVDGAGAWEETVKPGIPFTIDYNTMPHQLVRQADGTFLCSPVDWDRREVGDERTNPDPSFIGDYINKMFFYRNRLGMLSNENVILSRPGDFFNFWSHTAITISDADPIDLAATSLTPCELHDALGTKVGLLLFSRDRQFLFGTSNDVLSPSTAKIETYSTYVCNEHLPVMDMGTTVSFFGKGGKYSRLFEMTKLSDTQAPELIEQSKIVSEMLPSDITELAQSKENTLLAAAKRGTNTVYMYRYFNDGQERIMSSWFKWILNGNIHYHTVDKDVYFTVEEHNGRYFLNKTTLTIAADDDIAQRTDVVFTPRLDLRTTLKKDKLTYNPATRETTFTVPFNYYPGSIAFAIDDGSTGETIRTTVNDKNLRLKGDWTYSDLVIGYPYEMELELPHIYRSTAKERQSETDTRSYLTVHRARFQFADIGMFKTTVVYKDRDNYEETWEQSPGNYYQADTHEVLPVAFHTLPCYDKNTNFHIHLSSKNPFPAVVLSMEWEGRLTTKSYRNV